MSESTFLITGASRGIGLELTRQALSAGHQVFGLARNPKRNENLCILKRKYSDQLTLIDVDITDASQLSRARIAVGNKAIDVLINNAGMYSDADKSFGELDLEIVKSTFVTNTLGAMAVTQTFLSQLLDSPKPVLANITSMMGSIADNQSGGSYGYRISKAALNMFGRGFSVDFPRIITLILHPGWVQTDMGGSQAPVKIEESAQGILNMISKATKNHSGKFFNYRGDELPW